MAIFRKSNEPSSDLTNTTSITAGTKVMGDIEIEYKLQLDGEISGKISSKSIISIGRTGLIEGEIVSQKLIVAGRFFGTADCEEIEILAGGKVVGQITCNVLIIERSGSFEGESKLTEHIREDSTVIEIKSKSEVSGADK